MKLYPYNMGSASAKALAQALGIKRIKHEGKKLQVRGGILNWGASKFKRDLAHDGVLNPPDCVAIASNKLETFIALREADVSIPEFTDDGNYANDVWLGDGHVVVARTKLNGHSGEGIEIYDPKDMEKEADGVNFKEFNFNAPLYTKYIPKSQEYRLHVFQGEVFFVQRKARKKEIPDEQVNWKIRNHANGFIFAHNEGIDIGMGAKQLAVNAVGALGLDFGAVDMIYNQKQDKYYVLEINSAPGLCGETLEKYKEKFEQFR